MVQRLKLLLLWGVYILLAYMPFHLFLSRWLSLYTGGLGQWAAGKDILTLMLLVLALFIAFKDKLFKSKPLLIATLLMVAYGITHLLFIIFDREDQHTRSFIIATLYNGRIFAYLFIGIVAALSIERLELRRLTRLLIIVSTITCLFAFVQYLLPKDLMEHFGYSIERGVKPSFFIDDKPGFPRVMSTVRDPNSYGAYLIVPITLLWGVFIKGSYHKLKIAGLLLAHMLALFLTFSRGAWLGAILSLLITSFYLYRNKLWRLWHRHKLIIIALGVVVIAGTLVFRNTYVFQNVILHSDKSTVMADPNELRVQLQTQATDGILDDPEGHGPGTAGLVSIGNPNGTFLTENYFLQIGYEVGLTGLVLFLMLLVLTYRALVKSSENLLRVVLLSSFWAYFLISFLIHLWSNEAVAAQWWLLTGLIFGDSLRQTVIKSNDVNKR